MINQVLSKKRLLMLSLFFGCFLSLSAQNATERINKNTEEEAMFYLRKAYSFAQKGDESNALKHLNSFEVYLGDLLQPDFLSDSTCLYYGKSIALILECYQPDKLKDKNSEQYQNVNWEQVYRFLLPYAEKNEDIKAIRCIGKYYYAKKEDNIGDDYFSKAKEIYLKSLSPAARKVFESIKWVDIPAGSFIMGSPENEKNRYSDEKQHKVTLSSFKMSAHTITFEQYEIFCKEKGITPPSDAGWGRGTRPVINVSWEDAVAFADWLKVRLPTEAEWEYACRAGTRTPFNTGSNLTTGQANYDGRYHYNNNAKGGYRRKTVPVGSFAPNAWGLYDMHGNVWEWCADWYGEDYYSKSPEKDPKGPSSGSSRVNRGGSWLSFAQFCRSANRSITSPSNRNYIRGFRLVCPQ